MGRIDVCPYEAQQQLMVGIHAPSHLPSLHQTPGPLSEPPIHLHLKEGWPRRPSLCSLPYSRNDLIYLSINGNIGPPSGHPATLGPQQQNRRERERWKERIVIRRVIPDPTDRHHRAWFMCCGRLSHYWQAAVLKHVGGMGVFGAPHKSKRQPCTEVSRSHVWQGVTGCFR